MTFSRKDNVPFACVIIAGTNTSGEADQRSNYKQQLKTISLLIVFPSLKLEESRSTVYSQSRSKVGVVPSSLKKDSWTVLQDPSTDDVDTGH